MAAPIKDDNGITWETIMDGKLYPPCNTLDINAANKCVAVNSITIEQVREGVEKMKELMPVNIPDHQYIITHPDNVGAIRRMLRRGGESVEATERSNPTKKLTVNQLLMGTGCSVISQWWMDQYTDDVVLPCGRTVPRGELQVNERFVTYGPEDYDYLKYCGLIKDAKLPLVYVATDEFIGNVP